MQRFARFLLRLENIAHRNQSQWARCDHRDPGAVGWERKRRCFVCLICGVRFRSDEERPRLWNLPVVLTVIAIICVLIVIAQQFC